MHLPLVMGIVATGVLNVVASDSPVLPAAVRLLIAAGVAASLITMGCLELTLQPAPVEPTHPRLSPGLKFATGLIALAIGLWGGFLGSMTILSLLMALLLAHIVYGAYVWFRYAAPNLPDLL